MTENPYLEALTRVSAGRTASFAELARLAGRPAAARAAGRAVAAVPTGDPRPWHRIVRSDGGLAPDPARALIQLRRLRSEGARPDLGADVAAWLRNRRARCVGLWTNRMLFVVDDPRLPRLDTTRLEPFRDSTQGLERGFYIAPEPRGSAPRATKETSSGSRARRRQANAVRVDPKPHMRTSPKPAPLDKACATSSPAAGPARNEAAKRRARSGARGSSAPL